MVSKPVFLRFFSLPALEMVGGVKGGGGGVVCVCMFARVC